MANQEETNRPKFRRKEVREIGPTAKAFPFSREYLPKEGPAVYLSETLISQIFVLSRTGDVGLEHFGLLMGGYF